ncbi:MAG TPA: CPBP family intramembrane glutamic endopeptidase [Polyangiaceae bacterium]
MLDLAIAVAVARLVAGSVHGAMRAVWSAAGRWEGWVSGSVGLALGLALSVAGHSRWDGNGPQPFGEVGPEVRVPWWLLASAILVVNGLVVPVSEELVWRGLVQRRLAASNGAFYGVLGTSVMFTLKHVVVDWSWSRALTIVAIGLVLSVTAQASGWSVSTVAHAQMNVVATLLGLAASRMAPACLQEQPTIPQHVSDSIGSVLQLVGDPKSHKLEDVFSEGFLRKASRRELELFLERTHRNARSCAWSCVTSYRGEMLSGALACEGMQSRMDIEVEASAPYRVKYLRIISSPLY